MARALLAAALALLALAWAGQAAAGSAAYRRCGKDAPQPELNRCAYAEAWRQDAAVGRLYRALLGRQAAGGRSSLQAAQRAWRLFRDRQCGFAREEQGPYAGFGATLDEGAYCEMELNQARAGELRRLLAGTPRPAGDAAEAARQERALDLAWRRRRAVTEETSDLPEALRANLRRPLHPRAALDAAQRAWRLYRDRQCVFEADKVRCRIALTRERIEALRR